jgi:hypothetical protein
MTRPVWLCMVVLFCLSSGFAQQSPAASASGLTAPVPTLVNFGGTLTDGNGKPLTGIVGVTFYLYKDQQSSAPLWMETQNVQPDKSGRYSVMLGSTTSRGLPTDIFVSGEARWLAVQPQGQPEQPRTLLLSVPYALKAADAETVGGLPPSAFVLAAPTAGSGGTSLAASSSSLANTPLTVGGGGTVQFVPLWTPNGSTLGNSVLFQSGTGSTANVGINTTTPSTTLDVNGPVTVRGVSNLPAAPGVLLSALRTATPTQGFNSTPLDLEAQSFNTALDSGANYVFRWQAEPTGNDTSNTGATLHLLYGVPQSISETGLSINKLGILTFAPNQTFPGAGGGTVTSVGSGAGLTGGPITSSGTLSIAAGGITNTMLANPSLAVSAGTDLTGGGPVALGNTITLNLDTTKVPQLASANTFTGNQTVNGNLSATGVVGIGNTTPAARLTVSGSETAVHGFGAAIKLANTASGGGNWYLRAGATGTATPAGGFTIANDIAYWMTITSGGLVGIGNTTPAARLTVSGSETAVHGFGTAIKLANTASGGGNWYLRAGATGTATPAGGFTIANDRAYWMSITSGGLVGIGTLAPSNIFTIARGAGHAIADGWDTYSSQRWKTNVVQLHDALNKVQQLRGVSYDLKASGKHEIGLVAEEVGKVVPEVVSYEANGQDARGVDYARLTALLIEAVKEQQRQINRQQTQIRVQQLQIRKQQAQLRTQQSQLTRVDGKLDILEATWRTTDAAGKSATTVRSSGLAGGSRSERTKF